MSRTTRLQAIFGRERPARSGRTRSLSAALILLLCLAIASTLFAYIRGSEGDTIRDDVQRLGAQHAELLKSEILRSSEVVYAIRSFFAAHPAPTRAEFQAFVAPALQRQPELRALEWVPRVPQDQRLQYESQARADGFRNFQFTRQEQGNTLVRAPESAEYFPVFYVEPIANNLRAAGYDLASSSARRATLEAARDSASLMATCPIILAQETGSDPYGFLVVLPIYADGAAPDALARRRAALIGFTLAVFRTSDLIDRCLAPLAASGIDVSMTDAAWPSPIYHRNAHPSTGDFTPWSRLLHPPLSGTDAEIPIDIGSRRWSLRLAPAPAFVAQRYSWESWGALLACLILTGALATHLHLSARHAERIELHVARRTAELRREIQERLRLQNAARLAELQYRSIFENAIEGIFQTTPAGAYLNANASLARIYGFDSPEDLMGAIHDIAHDLYVDAHRRDEFIAAMNARGEVADFESRIRRRDGAVCWISENARAVRDAQGRLLYYEGTVVDVTRRMAAEDQVRRAREQLERRVELRTRELAQANAALQLEIATRRQAEEVLERTHRAKSEFMAMMTHELRTPMNAVLGYSQLMARDPAMTPDRRRAVDTIQTAAAHLMRVINEVLDLSKIESGCMQLQEEDFDLQQLVRLVAAIFEQRAAQKGIRLLLDVPHARIRLRGDEGKLRRILINLIGNALKFTDAGHVRLTIRLNGAAQSQSPVTFAVSDTGPGIPVEHHEWIFQSYRQSDAGLARGGTGLGLTIARQLVELMQAKAGKGILVASSSGQGASFSFALPLKVVAWTPEPDALPLSQASDQARPHTPRWEEIDITPDLLRSIRSAAESCSATELKRLAAELPRLSAAQQALHATLEARSRAFEFEAIRHWMDELLMQQRAMHQAHA